MRVNTRFQSDFPMVDQEKKRYIPTLQSEINSGKMGPKYPQLVMLVPDSS